MMMSHSAFALLRSSAQRARLYGPSVLIAVKLTCQDEVLPIAGSDHLLRNVACGSRIPDRSNLACAPRHDPYPEFLQSRALLRETFTLRLLREAHEAMVVQIAHDVLGKGNSHRPF